MVTVGRQHIDPTRMLFLDRKANHELRLCSDSQDGHNILHCRFCYSGAKLFNSMAKAVKQRSYLEIFSGLTCASVKSTRFSVVSTDLEENGSSKTE